MDRERGKRLRDARRACRRTLAGVATVCGGTTAKSTVLRWERGNDCGFARIEQLAALYGVEASWLAFGTGRGPLPASPAAEPAPESAP